MDRSSKGLKFVSVAILSFMMLAAIVLWTKSGAAPKVVEPDDQELISTFRAHRQAFEQLQQMVREDARWGRYLEGNDPAKLDQRRRDEYKDLIAQIHPGLQVAMTGPTGGVRFIFAGEGTAIGPDWVKGIEYVPGDSSWEGVRLPDLNKASSLPASVYVREMEPRWLIFYQRDE